MQAFVRLPTEFDNILLNAAGYFDISSSINDIVNITDDNYTQVSLHKADVIIYATSSKKEDLHVKMQKSLDNVFLWCVNNKIDLRKQNQTLLLYVALLLCCLRSMSFNVYHQIITSELSLMKVVTLKLIMITFKNTFFRHVEIRTLKFDTPDPGTLFHHQTST